jgi:hypothetical protein
MNIQRLCFHIFLKDDSQYKQVTGNFLHIITKDLKNCYTMIIGQSFEKINQVGI